ncbi:MAG: hypothetical protein A2175_02265 [Candidatus Nealsonbacteria bacterium RBG_13_42_11]|uniref:Methyltransferase type 11 domain-containing protein n=1 Tax=Candidatus Nealsonbacteria bacterium RBG_13_42_11 TaxID=1801663 RepID=A0A1G2DZI5_9BACT|nr:MAG: hypothetical protein A2175_02265 [Candidatus Nealsonbacteria bacterium RBG_13_42_11]
MKKMQEINEYWERHKGDPSILLPARGIQSRIALFEKNLDKKRVLHFGCSDWPYTKEKVFEKNLLHQDLEKVASELYGVDLSEEGIRIMKEQGIRNLFTGDIYTLAEDKNLADKKFDVILATEILEHLVNPGMALDSVKRYILKTNPECRIIFTVPNCQNFWHSFISGLRKKETVHYDHKFYFSYRTFRTLLEEIGFETEDFYFVTYGRGHRTMKGKIMIKLFSWLFQCLSPYLYFKCRVKK